MNHLRRTLILLIFSCSVCLLISAKVTAQKPGSGNFISGSLPGLKQLSTDLNQNVLAMLTMIKELEKYGIVTQKSVKITKPLAPVREADNLNSSTIVEVRMNEEFPVIEERDKYFKIRTMDGREGWIFEEDVQTLVKQLPDLGSNITGAKNQEFSLLFRGITLYNSKINDIYASAAEVIKKVDGNYNGSPTDKKREFEADYQSFLTLKEKIEKYYGYATRYIGPYENILASEDTSQPLGSSPGIKFNGTVSADAGWSSYRNMSSNSSVTRRLMFTGTYKIDNSTTANMAINHQKELIQTAFSNTAIDAGIARRFSDRMVMGANVNYNLYSDKASDINSFRMLSAGVNGAFNPSDKVNFFANAGYQSKNFKTAENNGYKGFIYVLGTNLAPNTKNLISIRIQGNTQSGEKDYLTFNQISPNFLYTHKRSKEKLFSLGLDFDVLKFAETNNINDYQKYKADLRWKNIIRKDRLSTRNLNLIYKQFPNNPRQDYYRMGYTIENRKGSLRDNLSSISSFGYLANVYALREDNLMRDYLDLRWDRSKIRPKMYSNLNFLTRLWNNIDMFDNDTASFPDHFIDFYGEVGPSFRSLSGGRIKIEGLRVGLLVGGHIFFNFDEDNVMRNGNSVRGGISASSNIKILKGSLMLAGSYERSLVMTSQKTYDPNTGMIVYGDIMYRKPSSFQFNVDYRQPFRKNWDIHCNLSNYGIRTDATLETSINPVEQKSSLRVMGGLIYRFAI